MFARDVLQAGLANITPYLTGRHVPTRWKPGARPRWDGVADVITMPTIPEDVSLEVHQLAAGLYDHETLHAGETDDYAKWHPNPGGIPKLLAYITNQLEDVRIELIGRDRSPGMRDNLVFLRKWSADHWGVEGWRKKKSDTARALDLLMYEELGVRVPITANAKEKKWMLKFKKLFAAGVAQSNTRDLFKYAERIHTIVAKEEKKREKRRKKEEKRKKEEEERRQQEEQEDEEDEENDGGDEDSEAEEDGDTESGEEGEDEDEDEDEEDDTEEGEDEDEDEDEEDDDEDEDEDDGEEAGAEVDDDGLEHARDTVSEAGEEDDEDDDETEDGDEDMDEDDEDDETEEGGVEDGDGDEDDDDDEDGDGDDVEGEEEGGGGLGDDVDEDGEESEEEEEDDDGYDEDALENARLFVTDESLEATFDSTRYLADCSLDRIKSADEDETSLSEYMEVRSRMHSRILAAKRMFTTALQTMAKAKTIHGRRRGQPYAPRYYSTRVGNRDICTQTIKGFDLDTCVTVLIDESGSQAGAIRAIQRLAIALGEIFDQVRTPKQLAGIPLEIIGTSTGTARSLTDRDSGITYSRRIPIELYVYKEFSEPFVKVKQRLMSMSARNHWIDGEVLAMAALRQRAFCPRVRRKVIIVLTDGQPEGGFERRDTLCNHLIETVERLRKEHFEVYSFGINTHRPKDFYGDEYCYETTSAAVDDGGPDCPFSTIARILMRGGS